MQQSGLQWVQQGTKLPTEANRSNAVKRRDEYHRSHKDAAVGATIDATKRYHQLGNNTATTATAEFSRIPRQTKRSRDQ